MTLPDERMTIDSRWLEILEASGLELTPVRLESIRADIEAVRRNIARVEALDGGSEEPAITLSAASVR